METIKAYHGTNKESANSILESTFYLPQTPSPNSPDEKKKRYYEYWLGPGVYLFRDYELSKWWSEHPPKTFSHDGEPAVIECELDISSDTYNVINLMDFATIREISKAYVSFRKIIENKLVLNLPKYENTNYENQLRSLFFKTLQKDKKVDIYIGVFCYKDSNYYTQEMRIINEKAGVIFPEIQYCVYNNKCIKNIQIIQTKGK